MPRVFKFSDLSHLYHQANEVDRYIHAEQRSNVLLAFGEHYNRRFSRFWGRLRDNQQINDANDQRLRITKNHIYRATRTIINSVLSQAPDVTVIPNNEREMQDQKSAELFKSVWEDVKYQHKFWDKVRRWCEDFVIIGEVVVKVMWDPNKGKLLGYEAEVDDGGEQVFDPAGNPIPSSRPVFSGDFIFERIMPFNLLRDPNAKEIYDSWIITRKMVDTRSLQRIYQDDEEKLQYIQPSTQDIYTVFEGSTGNFYQTKDQSMIKEYYWPVSPDYPKGYYYITTDYGILEEGELPFGVFPIVIYGWDEIQTTPRKRSIIKQLRATQAEINRTASQIATHQVSIGDTKLLIQAGTKVTQGGKLPGVRVMNYSGAKPEYFNGQPGDQYFAYLDSQIAELYQLAMIDKEEQSRPSGKLDPYAELFKSVKQKKKYMIYAQEFEHFLAEICKKTLVLAQNYYDENRIIPIVGRSEIVNIPEFKNASDLHTRIKVVPQAEDYETKIGKQITLTNAMQYLGSTLSKDDAGRIIRAMPYTNTEEIFTDWTTDYDIVTNDILALDRGETPRGNNYEDHKYAIKRLIHRMKQPDFQTLDPQIQQNYQMKVEEHEQIEAEQMLKMREAQSEFIPATGPLVKSDIYVTDPENPDKTSRAKIPMDAMRWLINKLEKQGMKLKDLEKLQQGAQADLAEQFLEKVPQDGQLAMPQTPPEGAIGV